MIKFTITTGIYPPDIGGPAKFIPRFASFLVNSGNTVTVLSLEDVRGQNHPVSNFEIKFIERNIPKIIRIPKTIFALIKLMRKTEIIFSNGLYEETAIAMFLCRKNGIAKIVGDPIWERYTNKISNKYNIEEFDVKRLPIKWRLEQKILIKSLKRFSHVYYPSEQLKSIFQNKGLNIPQSVIHNGVKCHSIDSVTNEFDVITVSRLTKWKNIDILIRACSELRLKLAIIGDGPELSNLRIVAEEQRAEVKFFGSLKEDEIRGALSRARIFVLISSYEGLSFALLEAMMSGKPIIVSNNAGNTQAITDLKNGIVVDLKDDDSLKQGLKTLIADSSLAKNLGEIAHREAKAKFCEEQNYKKILSIVESV